LRSSNGVVCFLTELFGAPLVYFSIDVSSYMRIVKSQRQRTWKSSCKPTWPTSRTARLISTPSTRKPTTRFLKLSRSTTSWDSLSMVEGTNTLREYLTFGRLLYPWHSTLTTFSVWCSDQLFGLFWVKLNFSFTAFSLKFNFSFTAFALKINFSFTAFALKINFSFTAFRFFPKSSYEPRCKFTASGEGAFAP